MSKVAASLRLAIALVCVGVGLIIGGQWVGLSPGSSHPFTHSREQRCEQISITAAMLIRDGQWRQLEAILHELVARDPDLISINLRSGERDLMIDATGTQAGAQHVSRGDQIGHRAVLEVGGTSYGQSDFRFRRPLARSFDDSIRHPLIKLIAFFVTVGVGVYTLFVAGIMRSFEVTRVVPDRIREALDTLSEGLLIMDERERVILANRSFSETVGIGQDKLIGIRTSDLPWVCSHSATKNNLPWNRAIRDDESQIEQLMQYRMPTGETRFFSINASPIASPDSKRRGALATFRDVTTVEEHRAELEHMLAMLRNSRDEISSKNRELEILAAQDALTGCLNRRALFERFEDAWNAAHRDRTSIACLMVDSDHFKRVNDSYGHDVGDKVLQKVASVIKQTCPKPALVCRYGGEEFCVVLSNTTLGQASTQAERIRSAIEEIRLDEPAELRLTASIGVSSLESRPTDPQDLIKQADKSLYLAKRSGRNRVITFSEEVGSMLVDASVDQSEDDGTSVETHGLPFQAVTALVSALAFRDSETAEHSRRVADLCVRAASGILDQRSTYVLEIAALLHDIGKIGVPDDILLKPGQLTPDEWKLMRHHDRNGVEIVAGTFNNQELNEIIGAHHAHYGGRASDKHLPLGNDIPVAARLLAIADGYDAMVSNKVYRRGRSHEEAIEELRRCAGTQFDPVLVEHFATTISQRHGMTPQSHQSIPEQTAMQIGLQIERLADALDSRDVDGLHTLASRLGALARHHRIESIATAAEKIEAAAAEENMQWIHLLRDTQLLLNLCRATQNDFLKRPQEAH